MPPVSPETAKTAVLLKLMGNPEKLAILALLRTSEHSIEELSQALGMPQTAVSKHLDRMRSEGMVDYTRYHRVLQYRLTSATVAAVLNALPAL